MNKIHTPWLIGLSLVVLAGCPEPGSLNPDDWPERSAATDVGQNDRDTANLDAQRDDVNGGCVPTTEFFETAVWEPFMDTVCFACHMPGGIGAQMSPLELIEIASPADAETNLAALRRAAAQEEEGESLLLLKPTGQVAHGGGPVLSADSPEYAALVELVARFDAPVACDNPTMPDAGGEDASQDTAAPQDTRDPTDTTLADTSMNADTAEPDTTEPDLPPDPPESQVWRFEGEGDQVSATTGQAFGEIFNLWANGELTASVDVPYSGDYLLRARVWGQQCCGDLVQMSLLLDGQSVLQTEITGGSDGEAEIIEYRITGLSMARHTIGVAFSNDFFDEALDLDRNLIIDWFELEGPLP